MIVVVPVPVPVITPVLKAAVATLVLLLVHVPPPASLRLVVNPLHKKVLPVIVPGAGLTVIGLLTEQPVVVIV